ncbi:hypothetical protein [Mesonia mobilis]|uniref:Lipocalin-like domain-containing protein n=1 Tax=Mesonia mobilis TaxID=369791 RepID=A0ABQ3C247_9FLAO|nr:hypothetical protein [Mesonia mobilis]MBQ0739546.1 hypothetical protein [Aquimarina celericrescens]GGZ64926.1 hypothetical protein GCM10008088_27990 [Mesonia mobilis]
MKKNFKFIFIFFLISCSFSKQEQKLIGNWYTAKNNRIEAEFQFYNDSLVIYEIFGKRTLKWDIKGDKIRTYYLKENGPVYKYHLDEYKQILNLELIGEESFKLPEFRKAKNAFDFFEKTIDLEIELPECNDELKNISRPSRLNFNIYAGFKHNNFIVKTDSATNLKNLEKEVTKFKNNTRNELKRFLRFNLIADKNITNSQLDSIKNRLKETSIKNIFRTYKNNQIDYKDNLIWFGKNE